jgi:hypothetical protein
MNPDDLARPLPTPMNVRVDQLQSRVKHLETLVSEMTDALVIASQAIGKLADREKGDA